MSGGTVASVAVLGSTGSIGTQALDVIAGHPQRFRVTGLAAGSNVERLVAQARQHRVPRVALADPGAARDARQRLDSSVEVLSGAEGVAALAGGGHDVVLNGMVGSRGLAATLAALDAGSRLALANKESLIVGGALVRAAAAEGQIVPVDSEHSAIAQCLRAGAGADVDRLILTASGGPFRGYAPAALSDVSVADALAHPTWEMGAVITVNSATLANKGLEVIEAHLLFGVCYDRITVVVHPQSVVHGMVEFCDGAVVAKLSPPDMRLPIQLALGWPDRFADAPARLDWTRAHELTFEPVDHAAFPLLGIFVAAGRAGGVFPAVANAANEEAVAAFLGGRIRFPDIAAVVQATLDAHDGGAGSLDLGGLLTAEADARARARLLLGGGTAVWAPCS